MSRRLPCRFFSAKSQLQPFAEKIQNLLQPSKVTAGLFSPDREGTIPFTLRNGIDHFTLPLQRIVFTYCPHNGDSRALMEYLSKNVISFAKSHPTVEVIVSCKFGSRAKIAAFYNGDYSRSRSVYVGGGKDYSVKNVAEQVQLLRDFSGLKAKKFKVQVLSDTPAIRPIYSQFMYLNPRAKFPAKKTTQSGESQKNLQ